MELLIVVDRSSPRLLQLQLYDELRRLILSGAVASGQRLPSSRKIAEQLELARNTVVLAYERLLVEGYVVSREKAGFFVNDRLPDAAMLIRNGHVQETSSNGRIRVGKIPTFSGRSPSLWTDAAQRPALDLFVGRPLRSSFPLTFWRRAASRHLSRLSAGLTEYGDPRGLLRLRTAIASHLKATRGISADPEQIVVTSGIQGALNLIARVFLAGRTPQRVAIENPCYQGAAYLFASYGAQLHPVDVDDNGLIVSQLDRYTGSLIYVTPSHQFPTGYTMPLDRRLHLLDWAYRTGTYVIEDDYDSDFRYDGAPLTALAGLDRRGRVIYLGTFSKSIGAGMRLGYAVLPQHIVEQGRIVKALLDNGAPWLEQAVLADFIEQGEFLRHLYRIRQLYLSVRDVLVAEIHRHFPGSVLSGIECGMHIMWQLPEWAPAAAEFQRLAADCGVGLYSLSAAAGYQFNPASCYGLRSMVVGYASLTIPQIREAISRLATAVHADHVSR